MTEYALWISQFLAHLIGFLYFGNEGAMMKGQRARTFLRIVATFAASSLGIISGSSVVGGIPIWKAAALAGFVATAQVLERLAKRIARR